MLKKIMFLSAIAGSMIALSGCDDDMSYITQVTPPPSSMSNVHYGEGISPAGSSVSYETQRPPVSTVSASSVSYGDTHRRHHHHHRHSSTVVVSKPSQSSVTYDESPRAPLPPVRKVETASQSNVVYGDEVSRSSVEYGDSSQ